MPKPVEEDEEVVGVIAENIQKLFCLNYDLRKEATRIENHLKRISLEHQLAVLDGTTSEEGCAKFQTQSKAMAEQLLVALMEALCVNNIFFNMFCLQFPPTGDKKPDIRENFQVVFVVDPDRNNYDLDEIVDGDAFLIRRRRK